MFFVSLAARLATKRDQLETIARTAARCDSAEPASATDDNSKNDDDRDASSSPASSSQADRQSSKRQQGQVNHNLGDDDESASTLGSVNPSESAVASRSGDDRSSSSSACLLGDEDETRRCNLVMEMMCGSPGSRMHQAGDQLDDCISDSSIDSGHLRADDKVGSLIFYKRTQWLQL